MADRKVSADTAALVAAQLTQASMAITGSALGPIKGRGVSIRPDAVEREYLRFLDFIERGATLPE
ncbi:hypothetical protein [Sphingomonas paucimobilis]|uniref:hypothetical protein n=1 Tax=Sphingomonas paucimobilis TaxID=13689 RepID=UPI00203EA74D|nr:hypothetical protein [Sphingomonas paucimobilis]MCM3679455.1 hypothetical protein [Sphingomonas paucimobilis]